MRTKVLAIVAILVMVLSALPQVTADWVEPVPSSKTDDDFWHVTYGFEGWWAKNWPNYTAKSSNREPDLVVFKDKLWILWEGLMVPNSADQPVSYKGKLYMRSYTDLNGTPTWSDIIDVTPKAFYADHTNQKARLISYNDRLYIFWQSYDRNQKPLGIPENRFDIMMRTYDGNELLQLTPPEIISRDSKFGDWGLDQVPQPVIFQDKLFVVWHREDMLRGIRDILYRVYDGSTWSDINVLSDYPNNDTSNQFATVAVWKGQRLYVMWQRTIKGATYMETVCSYTDNGHSWSAVEPLSRKIDITSVSFDTTPALATYHNPKTGKDELHAFWRTYKTENTNNGRYDYDIVMRVYDGTSWAPTKELSPPGDVFDDTQPFAIEFGQRLHIFWASKDDSTTDGKDYSIVRVVYDGETYGAPEVVSRVGDTDEAFMDDAEWWNRGDDLNPRATIYPDKWGDQRLFLSWWSFDYITGCCYDHPEDTHPTIVLRLLEDADHDKDGVKDHFDACPDDPSDWKDSDGDGVCDSKDWKPDDPTVWNEPTSPGGQGPRGDPLPLYMMLIVLFVLGVALLAIRADKKRPRPAKEEEGGIEGPTGGGEEE
jgi:hypothetical protein